MEITAADSRFENGNLVEPFPDKKWFSELNIDRFELGCRPGAEGYFDTWVGS
jgi:hypothetical protein